MDGGWGVGRRRCRWLVLAVVVLPRVDDAVVDVVVFAVVVVVVVFVVVVVVVVVVAFCVTSDWIVAFML